MCILLLDAVFPVKGIKNTGYHVDVVVKVFTSPREPLYSHFVGTTFIAICGYPCSLCILLPDYVSISNVLFYDSFLHSRIVNLFNFFKRFIKSFFYISVLASSYISRMGGVVSRLTTLLGNYNLENILAKYKINSLFR